MSTATAHHTTISEVFICRECYGDVALVVLPGGDLAYECISPRCCKTVSVDCAEALAIRDELTIELPASRVYVEVR
jgi:hypothetical protein